MGPQASAVVNRAASATTPTATWWGPSTLTTRHVLNRLGCGWSPEGQQRVVAAGGPAAWFSQQLRPAYVPESPKIAEINGWFSYLSTSAADRWHGLSTGGRPAFAYSFGLSNWTLLRRIYSQRPVLETMVDFWSDHFNVSALHDRAWLHRSGYDQTIRQHALGRFEDLLIACTLHPAMRFFFDNWINVAGSPNENHGRELLELHTVGPEAGYTEDMVKDSAAILSGYTVDWGQTFEPFYSPQRHTTGPVSVLGFHHANAAADGQAVTRAYLSYLARHPATARHIARRMVLRFVGDFPHTALIERLAQIYLSSGTDISAVLRELVSSKQFMMSAGRKVRRPADDLVATAKVLGVQVGAPTTANSWASVASFMHGGTFLYCWPQPFGPALADPSWCSAGRVFDSFRMHFAQTAGFWPTEATYRSASAWTPSTAMSLTAYINYLSQRLLGISADERITAAGVASVPDYANVTIGPTAPLPTYILWRLMIALLDSPDHMMR